MDETELVRLRRLSVKRSPVAHDTTLDELLHARQISIGALRDADHLAAAKGAQIMTVPRIDATSAHVLSVIHA